MEENVALDPTKQRKFVKSIKGIKKLIKKNESEKPVEAVSPKPKKEKPIRKRPERGLVYLSHIPHGFYENEMTQYFKQFGMVTNVRVIRSKHTGNSKGYAFVEFKETAVAEIVAETMNNYLMGKRLIKALYVPPEKQRPNAMRKHWSPLNNPGKEARLKMKKAYNENKDEEGDLKRARKIISNIKKTKKKLTELGISYDFFTPVDVPEALQDSLKDTEIEANNVKVENKSKKAQNLDNKDTKGSIKKDKKEKILKGESQVKHEKNKKNVTDEVKKVSAVKVDKKKSDQSKKNSKKNEVKEPVVNKKEQKHKQQKLKDAGFNLPENFVKVQEGSGDSDSSLEFDSDEYEKMLEDDSSDDSEVNDEPAGDENDASEDANSDEGDESEDEEEDCVPPPKKRATPMVLVPQRQGKKQKGQAPEQFKRKVPKKPEVSAKKPKFEKQNQQPMKKQFKKKK